MNLETLVSKIDGKTVKGILSTLAVCFAWYFDLISQDVAVPSLLGTGGLTALGVSDKFRKILVALTSSAVALFVLTPSAALAAGPFVGIVDDSVKVAFLKLGRTVALDGGVAGVGIRFFEDGTELIDAKPTYLDAFAGSCKIPKLSRVFAWCGEE